MNINHPVKKWLNIISLLIRLRQICQNLKRNKKQNKRRKQPKAQKEEKIQNKKQNIF